MASLFSAQAQGTAKFKCIKTKRYCFRKPGTLAGGRKKRTFGRSFDYDKANKNDRMFPEKMNKYAVRKEIAALIDSIKTHSDTIGTRKQIPQIELELILHKIEKLYQKSIVFNYLNSIDGGAGLENPDQVQANVVQPPVTPVVVIPEIVKPEQQETVQPTPIMPTFSSQPIISGLDEISNLIDQYNITTEPVTIITPEPEVKNEPVTGVSNDLIPLPKIIVQAEPLPEQKKEPVAEVKKELVAPVKNEPVITPKKEEIKNEPVIAPKKEELPPPVAKTTRTFPPIKSLMGFNDKMMFARSLFGNDNAVFEEALKQIDGCGSYEEASAFVSVLKTEMKWRSDDEIVESFEKIVRRRYS